MEVAIEIIQANPLFVASALASLVGLTLYYLYRGFIHENYQRIEWFRRLFLPHITLLLRNVDENNKRVDLSRLYVETEAQPEEEVFDLRLSEDDTREEAVGKIGDYLISEKFRPEVILASLAKHPEGHPEVGNFVLTAPDKNHDALVGYGVFKEIYRMLTSKYQLHLRLYYDEDKHRILFHAHHELNPYNPIYAKKHFNSVEFNMKKGVKLFRKYREGIRQFGVELIE
jgi:hypothetical protein